MEKEGNPRGRKWTERSRAYLPDVVEGVKPKAEKCKRNAPPLRAQPSQDSPVLDLFYVC